MSSVFCDPCEEAGVPEVEAIMYVGSRSIPMCDTCWPLADPALRQQGMRRIDVTPGVASKPAASPIIRTHAVNSNPAVDKANKPLCHCGSPLGHRGRHQGQGGHPPHKIEQRKQAEALLMAGDSVREVHRKTGLAGNTITNVRNGIKDALPPCGCGKPAGHNGWCQSRYEKSPERQAVMNQIHRSQTVSVQNTETVIVKREAAKENPIGEYVTDMVSDLASDALLDTPTISFWGRPVNPGFLDCLWLNLTSAAKARIMEHLTDVMFPVHSIECPHCKNKISNPLNPKQGTQSAMFQEEL